MNNPAINEDDDEDDDEEHRASLVEYPNRCPTGFRRWKRKKGKCTKKAILLEKATSRRAKRTGNNGKRCPKGSYLYPRLVGSCKTKEQIQGEKKYTRCPKGTRKNKRTRVCEPVAGANAGMDQSPLPQIYDDATPEAQTPIPPPPPSPPPPPPPPSPSPSPTPPSRKPTRFRINGLRVNNLTDKQKMALRNQQQRQQRLQRHIEEEKYYPKPPRPARPQGPPRPQVPAIPAIPAVPAVSQLEEVKQRREQERIDRLKLAQSQAGEEISPHVYKYLKDPI
jgi:hypothetical protein